MKLRAMAIGLLLGLAACQSLPGDAHTSENSLDWAGSYRGVLPCADCEGIDTTIRLDSGGSYRLSMTYLGKPAPAVVREGVFEWRADGRTIALRVEGGNPALYRVEENRLRALDARGEPITSPLADKYVLQKLAAAAGGPGR